MGILNRIFRKKKNSNLKNDIALAKDWIAEALNSSNYKADFSLESLKEIDRFFDEQNIPNGLLGKQRGTRLFALGVYIGEVFISECGGEWITDDNDPQGEINISVKLSDGNIIWPVQRAMRRYQNGKEDGIYHYGLCIIQKP